MHIGPYKFDNPVFLAPMAGITDQPFRKLCLSLGAGHAISEMTTAIPDLLSSRKTTLRRQHLQGFGPAHVQIAGYDPEQMANAARFNVEQGADIIDINMGCPAKKVCNRLSGSALLRDEGLVREILLAVTQSVDVPVTLKTRTGWDRSNRNALRIGELAEEAGIKALTLHGRTRCDFYKGEAEHETLSALRKHISIPLIANGDILDIDNARRLLEECGANAIMIGRGAQEQPWLPGRIANALASGILPPPPDNQQKRDILLGLVADMHEFYGESQGIRMARKHISWQLSPMKLSRDQRNTLLRTSDTQTQLSGIAAVFEHVDATVEQSLSDSGMARQTNSEMYKAA